MAEKSSVESTPIIGGLETAPLIFANGVYSFSARGGVASIILVAQRNATAADGTDVAQYVVIADLRFPIAEAANIRDALDKIVLGTTKAQGQA